MGFAAVAELNQQFGSFLAGVDQFDAAALGVSPAEALLMDPQQRLVMQSFSGKFALVAIWFVLWRCYPVFSAWSISIAALQERACDHIFHLLCHPAAEALNGHLADCQPTRLTGVYVGVSQLEYARISLEAGGGALNTYYATGAHLSVASGERSCTCQRVCWFGTNGTVHEPFSCCKL